MQLSEVLNSIVITLSDVKINFYIGYGLENHVNI
jgi:hypothetical protein